MLLDAVKGFEKARGMKLTKKSMSARHFVCRESTVLRLNLISFIDVIF